MLRKNYLNSLISLDLDIGMWERERRSNWKFYQRKLNLSKEFEIDLKGWKSVLNFCKIGLRLFSTLTSNFIGRLRTLNPTLKFLNFIKRIIKKSINLFIYFFVSAVIFSLKNIQSYIDPHDMAGKTFI